MGELIEAAKGAEAWLDRWASHVGNCRGGNVCTCGLTAIHAELRCALLDVEHDPGIPIYRSRDATDDVLGEE